MTRLEIHIDQLVLRDLPEEYVDSLPPLVEQRLAELAQRGAPVIPQASREPAADVGALAELIARQLWAETRGVSQGDA